MIAVANFKGGSGKTTTTAHLSQYLALQGFNVLCIDLDPQASLSALHGYQPEFDVNDNETIYSAIRYDSQRRSMKDVIKPSYFLGSISFLRALSSCFSNTRRPRLSWTG